MCSTSSPSPSPSPSPAPSPSPPSCQCGWSSPWLLPLIHGYFEQKYCSVYSRRISVCLISRRSAQFAGTRYLKRGINERGWSANHVETEQIVHERCAGDKTDGQFTSYVQVRPFVPSTIEMPHQPFYHLDRHYHRNHHYHCHHYYQIPSPALWPSPSPLSSLFLFGNLITITISLCGTRFAPRSLCSGVKNQTQWWRDQLFWSNGPSLEVVKP